MTLPHPLKQIKCPRLLSRPTPTDNLGPEKGCALPLLGRSRLKIFRVLSDIRASSQSLEHYREPTLG
jgi:hypothetical protein